MKRLLIGLVALVLIPLGHCWAQQSIFHEGLGQVVYPNTRDFTGGGARAEGMGNAFLGLSDDVTAGSWNPAGLYRQTNPYTQPVISLGYGAYKGDNAFTTTGFQGTQNFDLSESFNDVTLFSLVAPVRIKGHPFVGAITFNRLDDEFLSGGLRYDTTQFYTLEDIEENNPRPYSFLVSSDYHSALNAINFGFGTRLYDRLSMGASIGIYQGSALYNDKYTEVRDGAATSSVPPQRVLRVNDSLVIDSISYSGVFFTVGLQYNGDKASAGLVIRAPHKLKQDLDKTLILAQTDNGLPTLAGTEKYHFDNNLIEIDQPLIIGGGIAYRATEKLLVSMDAEYRAFGSGEIRIRDSLRLNPGDKDTEFFSTFDPGWENCLAFRAGGEYLLETGHKLFPVVPLRAGFGWSQLPIPDVDESFQTSTASKMSFSIGAGLRWAQIHLDAAFTAWSYDQEYTEVVSTGLDVAAINYTLETTDNRFSVTFTGFF